MDVHADIGRLAEPYLRGELDEAADAEIMAHAEACADCLSALRSAEARLRAPERFRHSPRFARMLKACVAAAVLVGLVCLGNAFQSVSTPAVAQEQALAAHPRPRGAVGPGRTYSMEQVACSAPDDSADLTPNRKLIDLEDPTTARFYGGRMSRGGGAPAETDPAPPEVPWVDDRKIVRNAQLQLEVESFEKTQDAAGEIAASEKGFVAGVQTQRLPNGKTSGTLTLRIPSDRFDEALPRFRALGTLRHQAVHTQDVSKTYVDLQARRAAKEALVERLAKVLAAGQGKVTELMEVELQMSSVVEALEKIKGEIRYYDNIVGLSSVVLTIQEREPGQPHEVVEILRASFALSARDVETVFAQVNSLLARGELAESTMTRSDGGRTRGLVRAHVDAETFPALRDELRALGRLTRDDVDRRRTAQGGGTAAGPAPLKRERAFVEVIVEPAAPRVTRWTRLEVEASDVDGRYQEARKAFEEAGATLTDGSLEAGPERSAATLKAEVDAEKAASLVARLSSLGRTTGNVTRQGLPAEWERAEVTLALGTPPALIPEEQGFARALRGTFTGSVSGLLWSLERLFVGASLVLPWAAVGLLGWLLRRRLRRRGASAPAAPSE